MTVTSNSVWYCSSVSWTAVTAWAASTVYTVGQLRRQLATPSTGNERVFVCIVAGTSLGTEPSWTLTQGAKTAETFGPTWMECTGKSAVNGDLADTPLSSANRSGAQVLGQIIKNNAGTFYFACTTAGTTGSSEPSYTLTAGVTTVDSGCTWTCLGAVAGFGPWTAPAARYELLATTFTSGSTTADRFLLSSDHTQTAATNLTLNLGLNKSAISVNKAGSVPPAAADITAGAAIASSGANAVTVNGGFWQGISFTAGSAANVASLSVGVDTVNLTMKSCSLIIGNTSTSSQLAIGNTGATWLLEQCQITLGSSGGNGIVLAGRGLWRGSTASAFTSSTFTLSGIFINSSCNVEFRDLDFSNLTSGNGFLMWSSNASAYGRIALVNCKLPSGMPIVYNAVATNGFQVDVLNCDSGNTNYRNEFYRAGGWIQTSVVGYHSGGASDGTTPFSHVYHALSLTATLNNPLEGPPLLAWNSTTGSSVTATVEIAGGGTQATLDPSRTQVGLALSPDLLTATNTSAAWLGSRSTASFTSGKVYVEFTCVAKASNLTFGIANALWVPTTSGQYVGADANSISYLSNGQIFTGGSGSGSLGTFTTGDVICISVDVTNNKIWWRKGSGNWNNDVIGNQNPATALGGTSIAALTALNGTLYFAGAGNAVGDKFTFNAGNTSFAQTPPSGFSGVLTAPGVTLTNADVWLDVEYLSASGSPLGQGASTGASVLATPAAVTASTETWTGLTAPVTQKLQVSFTPQKAGLVRAQVKVGNGNAVISVDPKLAVA